MELTGRVINILPEQKFNGRNGEVVRYGFVVETGGQYPKKVAFNVLGEDRWRQMNVQVNTDVQVSFDVESREWQGKWFTSANCWKVINLSASASAPQPQPQYGTNTTNQEDPAPF